MIQTFWTKILNSRLYFNLYYRWTKKHRKECKDIRDRVLKRRLEIIGK